MLCLNMKAKVSTLHLFKSIMSEKKTFPLEQPYKDLSALVTYILRQFFKHVEEDNFLLVEVIVMLNRPPQYLTILRPSSPRTAVNGRKYQVGSQKRSRKLQKLTKPRSIPLMSMSRKVIPGANKLLSLWLRCKTEDMTN